MCYVIAHAFIILSYQLRYGLLLTKPKQILSQHAIFLFDEKLGLSIFPNSRFSSDLETDVMYLLSRNDNFKCGIALKNTNNGAPSLWIGQYDHGKILKHLLLPGESIESILMPVQRSDDYTFESYKGLSINSLKRAFTAHNPSLSKFLIYEKCPVGRGVPCMTKMYQNFVDSGNISANYLQLGDIIKSGEKCNDVMDCPKRKSNSMEAVFAISSLLDCIGKKIEFDTESYNVSIVDS